MNAKTAKKIRALAKQLTANCLPAGLQVFRSKDVLTGATIDEAGKMKPAFKTNQTLSHAKNTTRGAYQTMKRSISAGA
jgi:hypothetical protein